MFVHWIRNERFRRTEIFLGDWSCKDQKWYIPVTTKVYIGSFIWNWYARMQTSRVSYCSESSFGHLTSRAWFERYQRLAGRLIYLSHTRPDIAYVISMISQFMHAPSEDHMTVVMRILSYLKGVPGKGLAFKRYGHMEVKGFTDADWARNLTDRRSTSSYFTFVAGNVFTWRSKKQKVTTRSSAEAEYRGMVHGICELIWLRTLLTKVGFEPKEPMLLYCDNQEAREIANNPIQHDRTKHIEVDQHFIKEKLLLKLVDIPFIWSSEQLADILTYAIPVVALHKVLDKLGLEDIFAPTWGKVLTCN